MAFDLYKLLKDPKNPKILKDMPPVKISNRISDKFIAYDMNKNRLDYIAGQVYKDETMWRLIMWANPEYFLEFDIPSGTILRVPYPLNDVISEVISVLNNNVNK